MMEIAFGFFCGVVFSWVIYKLFLWQGKRMFKSDDAVKKQIITNLPQSGLKKLEALVAEELEARRNG
jgi:hypothetical protein